MGGPSDEFVQCCEICDKADRLAVGLGHEEGRATPCGWFVDRCDDLAINELRDCFRGLRLIVFWYSPSRCDANRYSIVFQ